MEYEWSEFKNRTNIRKHGIDFETARHVFDDPNRIEFYDNEHSRPGEDRYNTIGFVHNLLFVVYIERKDNIIRIISARRATKEEQNGYYC